MSHPKLVPNDPRIQYRTATLNHHTYSYLYSQPTPGVLRRGTTILIHGFPDLSFGWRHQIPFLTSLGLTCIAPDCLGYGRSDAPPSSSLGSYSYRRIADDLVELCRQLGLSSVILGGHDWGGAIVYRVAQYHPDLVTAVFSVCTPYFPPNPRYEPLATLVRNRLPNFGYQMHFCSGELEERVCSKAEIKRFLAGMFGGRTPEGHVAFSVEKGVDFDALNKMPEKSPLLHDDELEYYAVEYARHGINGPLNWYRNREVNYVDELEYFFENDVHSRKQIVVEQEVLFVLATRDEALKPFMAERMGERISRLTRREVQAGHWALWQRPQEVNGFIEEWLRERVWGEGKEREQEKKRQNKL